MMKYFFFIIFSFTLLKNSTSQPIGTKRGLANGTTTDLQMQNLNGVHWWYNWSPNPESMVSATYQSHGYEFVPMVWNGNFDKTTVSNGINNDSKYILAFNEPNFQDQAHMTAQEAADRWADVEEIANTHNLKIVGPGMNWCGNCTSGYSSDPEDWLDDFFSKCSGCQVDYIAFHFYACGGSSMQSQIDKYKKYGKPLWVTEFACWDNYVNDDAGQEGQYQKEMLVQTVDILEKDPDVFRYSWFSPVAHGDFPYINLFTGLNNDPISELGKLYRAMPVHDDNYYYTAPLRMEAANYALAGDILLELTEDVNGFLNVGYIDANDWLEYNIDVPSTAEYDIYIRYASPNSSQSIDIEVDGNVVGDLSLASTGGWQIWETSDVIKVDLTTGNHKIKVSTSTGGFNLGWLAFDDGTITSMNENGTSFGSSLEIFPNPVNRFSGLKVQSTNRQLFNKEVEVTITNMIGQEVVKLNNSFNSSGEFYLDDKILNSLDSGMYILNIQSESVIKKEKFTYSY